MYSTICGYKIISTVLYYKEDDVSFLTGHPYETFSRFKNTAECIHVHVVRRASLSYAADPRRWSREDVTRWLQWTSEMFHLGSVRPDRFQMNGKALCLMTMDMFLYRVPEGGNILYQDFQRRLRNAVAMQN